MNEVHNTAICTNLGGVFPVAHLTDVQVKRVKSASVEFSVDAPGRYALVIDFRTNEVILAPYPIKD